MHPLRFLVTFVALLLAGCQEDGGARSSSGGGGHAGGDEDGGESDAGGGQDGPGGTGTTASTGTTGTAEGGAGTTDPGSSTTGPGGSTATAGGSGAATTPGTGDTTATTEPPPPLPGDYDGVWEIRVPSTSVSAGNPYRNFTFEVAIPAAQAHIVAFEAVLDQAPYVHHFLFSQGTDVSLGFTPGLLWVFVPGEERSVMPDDVGLLINEESGGMTTFSMQVHYNNPLGDAVVDSSGVNVYYTTTLRPKNAGVIVAGSLGTGDALPAGCADCERVASCGISGDRNVFRFMPHMHITGKAMRVDQVRDGSIIGTLGDTPTVFGDLPFRDLQGTIQSGDVLDVHCAFDTTGRTGPTLFGTATENEMCAAFYYVWPAPASGCSASARQP